MEICHFNAFLTNTTDFYIHGRETGKLRKKNDEGYFQIFITFGKMRIFECGFRQYVSNLYGK